MKQRLILLAVPVIALALAWQLGLLSADVSADRFARQIRLALAKNPADAWKIAQRALAAWPENPAVVQAAAEAAAQSGADDALKKIATEKEHVLLADGTWPGQATIQQLIDSGHHRLAKAMLDLRLRQDPAGSFALRNRAALLLSHGRYYAARDDLQALLSGAVINLDELVFLSSRREFLEDEAGLKRALAVEPGYAPATLGLAALAAFSGNLPSASDQLKTILSPAAPPEAWALQGMIFYRLGLISSQLKSWQRSVRLNNVDHPDISFVLGWVASQEGRYQDAVKQLSLALQSAHRHRPASQLLAQLLRQHSSAISEADFLSARATSIDESETLAHDILFGDRSSTKMRRLAELFDALGEPQLSQAWARAAQTVSSGSRTPTASVSTSRGAALEDSTIDPTLRLDELLKRGLADQFGIVNAEVEATSIATPPASSNDSAPIQFVDVAAASGITETYYGGFDDSASGLWIYQGFGGGVGVIDFDGDDQPDFCVTQGRPWKSTAQLPREHQDLLYRQQNGRYDQVNRLAFENENGLGQGVSVGDFDRDGFQDLYIANIGANHLLINNGDGTFRTVILPVAEHSQPGWTTSCLMADLDGDGFDDLYDVQYATGNEPFERICHSGPDNLFRGCLPTFFEAAHDVVLQNKGDGEISDLTESSGLMNFQGRGLGILAADLNDSPGLEMFVSNDMSPNHLLEIQKTDTGLRLVETAGSTGLGSNGEGQIEACMGIAAADFSGDGAIDLFVTNFFEETNTFYVGQGAGFFMDQTRISRLGPVSLKKLAFGTQPLDADNDTDWDLLITNGHVDDFRYKDIPWKMTPDLMQNVGSGGFERCPDASLGEYGHDKTLGRAVATVDWNRDGLLDAIVTHLDRHPALLQNETATENHSLSLHLIGIDSNRPAIGATISVTLANRELVVQRVAGDGYYCSNDQNIVVGVGAEDVVSEVAIRWPSGTIQKFQNVPTDSRLRAVEGHRALYTITP